MFPTKWWCLQVKNRVSISFLSCFQVIFYRNIRPKETIPAYSSSVRISKLFLPSISLFKMPTSFWNWHWTNVMASDHTQILFNQSILIFFLIFFKVSFTLALGFRMIDIRVSFKDVPTTNKDVYLVESLFISWIIHLKVPKLYPSSTNRLPNHFRIIP